MIVDVIREPGDVQAPDIIDKLLKTNQVMLQRGRNFLDEHGHNKSVYDLQLAHKDFAEPGAVVQVADASLGETFRGKLISWAVNVEGQSSTRPISITINASIERSLTE